ncbi:nitroreductase family protein [Pyrobaculum aerophilum]|uniref:Reductase, putative n=2 Tax=Pyrobaculum aerophilum TaxID=13773 RepID=Q8ZVH8_PYRAE|nr:MULTISPECIES: nitroreductase family protein [Pyrobaculum]AAL64078.1 reductase, putative [Pyrobaculum aerophilum str. IM2]MCX8135823.1 nitroreductase family protein [Pyrobaculum aerophilum]HII47159.1 NADPH-dependent oxidoreductase [Pyrobaculum aerophilum]
MEFFEVVNRRRSVRRFKRVKIPEDDVKKIMEAGRLAPTDATLHLWSAVWIRDDVKKSEIAKLIGQPHVEEGSDFFIFLADLYRLRELLKYRGREIVANKLALFVFAAVDAALAAENMALAATALGYGSCFIGAVQNAVYDLVSLLKLPDLTYPLFGLVIGVPDEDPPRRPRLPADMLFHREEYRAYREDELKAAYEIMGRVTRSGDWLRILERYAARDGYFDKRSDLMISVMKRLGFM